MATAPKEPLGKKEGKDLVSRRHPEWNEHQRTWRWLADSYEGGNRYRQADYTVSPNAVVADGTSYAPWYTFGFDPLTSQQYNVAYGQVVDRNLIPHLSETGTEGRDLYVQRLARTPVPTTVEHSVESHLTRIYAREVKRAAGDAVAAALLGRWWEDCDGRGTPIGTYMEETVAPLLSVLGQVDLCFDHPEPEEGADIATRADVRAAGLDRCVCSVILPENLMWWRLDRNKARYAEALVFERYHGGVRYRHWTDSTSYCYSIDGKYLAECSHAHPFGRVPIVRFFDRRLPRAENTGKSRYVGIAMLMRAIYNARSELVISDVQQSHAQLQGPAEYLQQDSKIPIGPDKVLPMRPLVGANGMVSGYQGFSFVDPPKTAQEAVRQHVEDYKDEADRAASLSKPAGQTTGSTVAQSGVSKICDQVDGNALLAKLARTLEACEAGMAAMAIRVMTDGEADDDVAGSVSVGYPQQFDLYSIDDLAAALTSIQTAAGLAGALPETEGEFLKRIVNLALPGIDDDRLAELHAEVASFMDRTRERAESESDGGDGRDDAATTADGNTERAIDGQDIILGPSALLSSPQPS